MLDDGSRKRRRRLSSFGRLGSSARSGERPRRTLGPIVDEPGSVRFSDGPSKSVCNPVWARRRRAWRALTAVMRSDLEGERDLYVDYESEQGMTQLSSRTSATTERGAL